jgi:hypothetical protein
MYLKPQLTFVLPLALLAILLLACDLSSLVGGVATKPNVIITAPASGARVDAGAQVAVQSTATDAHGIAWIELWVDGIVVGNQTLPAPQTSYTAILPWRATTPGAHVVQVKAYNTAGAASDPAVIALEVVPVIAQATPPSVPTIAPLPTIPVAPTATPTMTATPTLTPTATLTPTLAATPTLTPRPEGNCADPGAKWENVVDGQTLEPLAAFIGTANHENFERYVVEWLRPGNVLHRSATPVVRGVIFVWNTYTVSNGEYPVALIVYLKDGTNLAPCVVRVRVAH